VQPGQRVAAQPAVQDEVETFPDELPDEGRLSRHGRRPFPLLLTVYSSPVSVTLPTLEDLHALKPLQQPSYPDPAQVADVVARLRALPRLVFAGECDELRGQLASVAAGEAFVLQGGDCAETFAGVTAANIQGKLRTLLSMAVVLTYAAQVP